jgi:type VI secretion system secreted protein VgrG
VTTHSVTSQPLDAREASNQLVGSEGVIEAASQASEASQAESLKDGHDALKSFTDATQHSTSGTTGGRGVTAGGGTGNANAFSQPVMLFAAPAGIALSTQKSAHIATDQHINLVSGQSTHIATGKSLVASITNRLSLFVQNAGMKLFAAKGKVEVQAHADNVELTAQKSLLLTSVTEKVQAAAQQEILLTSGGAYIRIKDGNIEIHAPGKLDFKGADHAFSGPTRMDVTNPAFKDMPTRRLMVNTMASPSATSVVPAGMPYKLFADGALVKQGVFDKTGQLPIDHHVTTQKYTLEMANGVKHEIPVPGEYKDPANGALANQGFPFHESLPGGDSPAPDRAAHRQYYSDGLNPPSDA